MFLTKRHLPRRTFLRGIGAAISLPLLDAMIPARDRVGADRRRAEAEDGFLLFSAWGGLRSLDAASRGRSFDLPQILARSKNSAIK
jgi:hypothetical protein